MRATIPQAMMAADDLLMMMAGRVCSGADWGSPMISVGCVGATLCRFAVGAMRDAAGATEAGAVAAGDWSIMVPAGRTSRYSCAHEVTIAPTIADFHRSSDAAGDQ